MLTLGCWWDGCFDFLHGIETLPGSGGVLRFLVKEYRGESFILKDGTAIEAGDLVAELHLGSVALVRLGVIDQSAQQTANKGLKLLQGSLSSLAKVTLTDSKYQVIKAFYGITLLVPGARRLGFEVRKPVRDVTREARGMYLLECWYRSAVGLQPLREGKREAREIWISRYELQRRFGQSNPGKA